MLPNQLKSCVSSCPCLCLFDNSAATSALQVFLHLPLLVYHLKCLSLLLLYCFEEWILGLQRFSRGCEVQIIIEINICQWTHFLPLTKFVAWNLHEAVLFQVVLVLLRNIFSAPSMFLQMMCNWLYYLNIIWLILIFQNSIVVNDW